MDIRAVGLQLQLAFFGWAFEQVRFGRMRATVTLPPRQRRNVLNPGMSNRSLTELTELDRFGGARAS
jgi:hypothetical protein